MPNGEPDDVAENEVVVAASETRNRVTSKTKLLRPAVGSLGLGAFVLGATIAWKSQSSTVLLIVGAIILVLAVLGLEWDEIRGTYGGASVQLLRRGLEHVEMQVEETRSIAAAAATEDASSEALHEVVERLDSLGEQVKALTPPPPQPRRPRGQAPSLSTAGWDEFITELRRTRATHEFREHSVGLSVRTLPKANGVKCTVKTPSGSSYVATTRRPISVVQVTGVAVEYRITYPNDFSGSEPLTPGRYEVEWRESFESIGPMGALAQQFAEATRRPFAEDAFTIPGPA